VSDGAAPCPGTVPAWRGHSTDGEMVGGHRDRDMRVMAVFPAGVRVLRRLATAAAPVVLERVMRGRAYG
jgi:hypothetical protein